MCRRKNVMPQRRANRGLKKRGKIGEKLGDFKLRFYTTRGREKIS